MTSSAPQNFKVQRGQRGDAKRGEVPRPTVPAFVAEQKVIDGRSPKALQYDHWAAWKWDPSTPKRTWEPILPNGCSWRAAAKAGRAGGGAEVAAASFMMWSICRGGLQSERSTARRFASAAACRARWQHCPTSKVCARQPLHASCFLKSGGKPRTRKGRGKYCIFLQQPLIDSLGPVLHMVFSAFDADQKEKGGRSPEVLHCDHWAAWKWDPSTPKRGW